MNPNSLYYSKSDRDSSKINTFFFFFCFFFTLYYIKLTFLAETSSLTAKYFMSGNDAHFKHNEILCNSTTTEMKRSSSQTEVSLRTNLR